MIAAIVKKIFEDIPNLDKFLLKTFNKLLYNCEIKDLVLIYTCQVNLLKLYTK